MAAVSKESITSKIKSIDYTILEDNRTTVCRLTMENGFTIIGTSSCVNLYDFDKEKGEMYAYDKAFEQIWVLEGYLEMEKKHNLGKAFPNVKTTGLTFGEALEALKRGLKVAREGWNGKGMWLSLSTSQSNQLASARSIPAAAFWSENNRHFAEDNGGFATVLPCITMKTATNEILMGWLASQSDMLSNDWKIV